MRGRRALRAFISHSWADKPLARRVAYRLSQRGVPVWIDEAEMQVGDRLSERLATEILDSTHLVVLMSAHANASNWVRQEIEVAQQARRPISIIPLAAETGVQNDLLKGTLGVEIVDPLVFEDRMDVVANAILGARRPEGRDLMALRRDLDAIGRQEPYLKNLIVQLADEGRITHAQLGSVSLTEPLRHPAETALIALHERADSSARDVVSLVAARLYTQMGVGYPVLLRQIVTDPRNSNELGSMFITVSQRLTRPADLDGVFQLFTLASPPQDQAFAEFIRNNFDQFTARHRDMAVNFVVTPDRGPAGFGIDAAYALFAVMPESAPLRDLWFFWVNDYRFGGKEELTGEGRASAFYSYMNEAAGGRLAQFDRVMDHFETRYRHLAKSGNRAYLNHSVGLLVTAAESQYVRRAELARQLAAALRSTEWSGAEQRGVPMAEIWDLARAIERDEEYRPLFEALVHRPEA